MLNSLKYKFHKMRRQTEGKPAHGELVALIGKKKIYLDDITVLLQRGSDINETDTYGYTALIAASWRGYDNAVKHLIDNKADVHHKNIYGDNALLLAAKYGQTNIIRMLYAAGANINDVNENGDTPLIVATREGNINTVQLLLNLGADKRIKNKQGLDAGHLAGQLTRQYIRRDDYFDFAMRCSKIHHIIFSANMSDLENSLGRDLKKHKPSK